MSDTTTNTDDTEQITKRETVRLCRSADSQLYNARTLLDRIKGDVNGHELQKALDEIGEAQKLIGNAIYWTEEIGDDGGDGDGS